MKKYYCSDCGEEVSWQRERCRKCALIKRYQHLGEHGKERHASRQRARREDRRKPCPECGIEIAGTSKHCKICTRKFSQKYDPTTGHGWNWKGGRTNHQGYIKVRLPMHHRAHKSGYVLEHIVIWEEANGRPLPDGWMIHHLNGLKNDNRPSNLEALKNRKHYLVLQAKARRIQQLEARLRQQDILC